MGWGYRACGCLQTPRHTRPGISSVKKMHPGLKKFPGTLTLMWFMGKTVKTFEKRLLDATRSKNKDI